MQKSITVNQSVANIYAFWRDFQNLPRILEHLDSVQSHNGQTYWKASLPQDKQLEWITETVEDVPNERISWQSIEGAPVKHSSIVSFTPAPGEWGTEVTLTLDFDTPVEEFENAFTKLLGAAPEVMVNKALYNFKSLVETGEIPTTKNQPAARNGGRDDKEN